MAIRIKNKILYKNHIDDSSGDPGGTNVSLPPSESEDTTSVFITDIVASLMSAKVNFHILHFQTRSHAKHLALDDLYTGVTSLSDDIIECLLGRLNTRIPTGISIVCNPLQMEETETNITDQINLFSNFVNSLFEWSNQNNYQDLANLAAELQQLVNKTKYRLTLC